uniref:Uncharacterized protein n=1 Tax=uncultured prokaryote TaxID=198431 RepID=A0A0H5Q1N2_9ZZZZ|nr:hypothetical protein [uncultured prokaryote]
MPTDSDRTWQPHVRIQIGGTLGVPAVEIWSNAFRYYKANGVAPNAVDLQGAADALAGPVSDWITRPESLIGNVVGLTYIKAVWVQSNGRQRDTNTAQHEFAPAVMGTNAQAAIWEQTYCLTFRTPIKRGRAHSGRIYPPVAGHGAGGGTPYCSAADADGMAASGAQLLTAMGNAIAGVIEPGGPTGGFYVFSPGEAVRGTQPVAHPITSVVVDRVADIMHSRTNRVPRAEGAPSPVPLN